MTGSAPDHGSRPALVAATIVCVLIALAGATAAGSASAGQTPTTVGAAPLSASAAAKCGSPERYMPRPSVSGALAWARRDGSDFEVIVAHRARTGDWAYDLFIDWCGRRVARRSVFVNLHPPGMQCAACNARMYIVKVRGGSYKSVFS